MEGEQPLPDGRTALLGLGVAQAVVHQDSRSAVIFGAQIVVFERLKSAERVGPNGLARRRAARGRKSLRADQSTSEEAEVHDERGFTTQRAIWCSWIRGAPSLL